MGGGTRTVPSGRVMVRVDVPAMPVTVVMVRPVAPLPMVSLTIWDCWAGASGVTVIVEGAIAGMGDFLSASVSAKESLA